MECPVIYGLGFDGKSVKGIKEIRTVNDFSDKLAGMLAVGTMAAIFVGSKPLQAAHNIKKTDWEVFAKAMTKVPTIKRRRISQIAKLQIMDHYGDPKQGRFWEGVRDGCGIE